MASAAQKAAEMSRPAVLSATPPAQPSDRVPCLVLGSVATPHVTLHPSTERVPLKCLHWRLEVPRPELFRVSCHRDRALCPLSPVVVLTRYNMTCIIRIRQASTGKSLALFQHRKYTKDDGDASIKP